MDYSFYDFIGNIGVALILGAYLALQLEKVDSQTRLYSAINGLGAGLILVSLYFDFNLSAALIESVWLLISLYGVFKARR